MRSDHTETSTKGEIMERDVTQQQHGDVKEDIVVEVSGSPLTVDREPSAPKDQGSTSQRPRLFFKKLKF